MRAALPALSAVLAVVSSGWLVPVISYRADTVVTVHRGESEIANATPMGFRWSYFKQDDHSLVIQSSGTFPREHETWVFMYLFPTTSHPYPDYWRYIRITCRDTGECVAPQDCRIQMLLQQGWPTPTNKEEYEAYEGETRLQFAFDAETVSTKFSEVKLVCPVNPDDIIYVSGKVDRKRPDECDDFFTDDAARFDERWAKATHVTTELAKVSEQDEQEVATVRLAGAGLEPATSSIYHFLARFFENSGRYLLTAVFGSDMVE